MNALIDQFGTEDLVVLAIPCNQFGHQQEYSNEETLNGLKYVRPGGGYEPKFNITEKACANGDVTHPIYAYLKEAIPRPHDDHGGQGHDHISTNLPPQPILYSPIRRTDLTWNFEKFLMDKDGVPVRRYSPRVGTEELIPDIEKLLKGEKLD